MLPISNIQDLGSRIQYQYLMVGGALSLRLERLEREIKTTSAPLDPRRLEGGFLESATAAIQPARAAFVLRYTPFQVLSSLCDKKWLYRGTIAARAHCGRSEKFTSPLDGTGGIWYHMCPSAR